MYCLTINRIILILVDYAKYVEAKKSLHKCLAIVRRLFEKAQTQKKFTLSVNAKTKQAKS